VSLNRALVIYVEKAVLSRSITIYNAFMNKILVIIKWEISRILSNWRKAAAVFIIPAAVMMVALNLFPYLINYMSTGSLSGRPIIVVNAPDSFEEYIEDTSNSTIYKYEFISTQTHTSQIDSDKFLENIRKGYIYCVFHEYQNTIEIQYNRDSSVMSDQVYSFIDVVINKYNESESESSSDSYTIDGFNPVTKLLDYRGAANYASARVIPAVLVLIIYYCTYSLMVDIFASEKDRGFWNKLIMTPVSPVKIVLGKMISVIGLVSAASYTTFAFLFLSSWLNRNNSSTSLIPFGLLLLPRELLALIIIIPVIAFLCASICLAIIFSVKRMKDVILNLQMPLIFILFDLFLQLFYYDVPNWTEYYIPLHNGVSVLRAALMTELGTEYFAFAVVLDIAAAMLILLYVLKKEGYINGRITKRT